eukprot:g38228.t1
MVENLIKELKVKEPLGGSDHKVIEFTLHFERQKLKSDVMVLELSEVEDTSSVPDLQASQRTEVNAVVITQKMREKLTGLKVDKSFGPDGLHSRHSGGDLR